MAKWLIPVLLIATGVCVFAGGLMYGVVTVGVPTPDATPAVAAREVRDADAAGLLVTAGLMIGAVGVAALTAVAVAQAARRRAPDAEQNTAADGRS
jgi:hypothetical protein